MAPCRGLSMSAMRKSEMDRAIGKIRKSQGLLPYARQPVKRLQKMEIAITRVHAATGIRFHHAACVYPCEFNTSFMPATMRAATGVGCAAAGVSTADHIWVCS